jgi:hypothetical protein
MRYKRHKLLQQQSYDCRLGWSSTEERQLVEADCVRLRSDIPELCSCRNYGCRFHGAVNKNN